MLLDELREGVGSRLGDVVSVDGVLAGVEGLGPVLTHDSSRLRGTRPERDGGQPCPQVTSLGQVLQSSGFNLAFR